MNFYTFKHSKYFVEYFQEVRLRVKYYSFRSVLEFKFSCAGFILDHLHASGHIYNVVLLRSVKFGELHPTLISFVDALYGRCIKIFIGYLDKSLQYV